MLFPSCSISSSRNGAMEVLTSSLSSQKLISSTPVRISPLHPSSSNYSYLQRISTCKHTVMAAVAPPVATKSIAQTFSHLKARGKVALIPYITAGDPNLSTTANALMVLDSCGADVLELGVPYSDPLADGPVIQAAATRALRNGTNLDAVLKMLSEVVPRLGAPLVLFTYYNPVLKRGIEEFLLRIKTVGVKGLVVPDLPLEEIETLRRMAADNGIELVLLTTPTTPKERMDEISKASQGFVYLVSLTGVTGARSSVEKRVEFLLQELKKVTEKPVAVGFGISKPEHAVQIANWGADGVIVGSAMVKVLGEASSPEEGLAALRCLTQELRAALP